MALPTVLVSGDCTLDFFILFRIESEIELLGASLRVSKRVILCLTLENFSLPFLCQ